MGQNDPYGTSSVKTLQFSFVKSLKKQEILCDNSPRHGASRHKKNFFNFAFVKRCLELRNYFAAVTEGT